MCGAHALTIRSSLPGAGQIWGEDVFLGSRQPGSFLIDPDVPVFLFFFFHFGGFV